MFAMEECSSYKKFYRPKKTAMTQHDSVH